MRRPAAEYFSQKVSSNYCTAMPPSFPHKFTLGWSSADKDNSEQTYPCGKRLAAVASSVARAGPAAALPPPAALDAAMPSAAAWLAIHAQLLIVAVAATLAHAELMASSPSAALDSAAPAGGSAVRAQPNAAACAAAAHA